MKTIGAAAYGDARPEKTHKTDKYHNTGYGVWSYGLFRYKQGHIHGVVQYSHGIGLYIGLFPDPEWFTDGLLCI